MATSNFPRFGTLFKGALKTVFKNLGVYFPIILLFSVLTVLLVFGVGYVGFDQIPQEPDSLEEAAAFFSNLFSPQLVLLIVAYILITALLNVFFPLAILKAHQQKDANSSEAIAWAAKNLWNGIVVGFLQFWYAFWKAVWPGAVVGLLALAMAYFELGDEGVLKIVFIVLAIGAGLNFFYYIIKRGLEATFSLAALAEEGKKGWAAVDSSIKAASGHLGSIFVTLFFAGILLALMSLPFTLLVEFMSGTLNDAALMGAVVLEFLIGAFLTAVVTVLIYDIYKAVK